MLPGLVLLCCLQVTATRAMLVADLGTLNRQYWACSTDCKAIRTRIDSTGDQLVTGDLDYLHRDRLEFERLTRPAWQQPSGQFRIPPTLLKLIPFWRRK